MNKLKLRRIKKKICKNKVPIMIIGISLLLLTMGIGYAAQNSILNLNGEAVIQKAQNFACASGISGSFTYNTHWSSSNDNTNYNYTLKIHNDTEEVIETWEMRIKGVTDTQITTNADIVMESDDVALLTPLHWNSRIGVGQTLTLDVNLVTYQRVLNVEYIAFGDCKIFDSGGGGTIPDDPDEPENPDVPVDPDEPEVQLTALSITPSEYEMTLGEVAPLQVTKTPSNAVVDLLWVSSDNTVVSVDENGIITALKEGNATITVSANGISASSYVTVVAAEAPPIVTGLDIEFSTNYNNQNQMHFKIAIVNNTDQPIKRFSFDLSMPDGTSYSLWNNPGGTVTGNTFNVSLNYGTIAVNGSTEITGSITLPNGYNSSDYLNPTISNIIIKE